MEAEKAKTGEMNKAKFDDLPNRINTLHFKTPAKGQEKVTEEGLGFIGEDYLKKWQRQIAMSDQLYESSHLPGQVTNSSVVAQTRQMTML
jgi:hypothetical protein